MKAGTKILVSLLVFGLLPALVLAAISVRDMISLSQYSMDANTRLAVRTSDDAQKALLSQAEQYVEKIAYEQAFKFEHILRQVQTELSTMSEYIRFLYANEHLLEGEMPPLPNETQMGEASAKYMLAPGVEMNSALRQEVRLLGNCKNIFQNLLGNDSSKNNIYIGTESGISYRYSRSNAYNKSYDPRLRQWYTLAKEDAPKVVWVDTYVDPYGTLCVTCAVAFYDAKNVFRGVVAMDITAVELQRDIENTELGKTGFAFLLDGQGQLVAYSPRKDANGAPLNPAIKETAYKLPPTIVDGMLHNPSGILAERIEDADRYVAYAQLPSTGWRFGIAVEKNEIVAPALATKQQVDTYISEAQGHITSSLQQVLLLIPVIIGIYTIALLVVAYFLSRTITTPLHDTRSAMKQHADGGPS